MLHKALIVGIDYYATVPPLHGCVADAYAMKSALERHADDGSVNFSVSLMTGTGPSDPVTRNDLRKAIEDLFQSEEGIALFYFAGHGFIDDAGGYICASDSTAGHDGVALADVLGFANRSRARSRIVVLDSCHSGIAGNSPAAPGVVELQDGVTVMTASTAKQYASEENGSGVFTSLFVDALHGGAANLVGEITPGSIYAHIDQSLGPWKQRPVFKTNVKHFVSLRRVTPPIPKSEIRQITSLFPTAGFEFQLDPSFEPVRSEEEKLKFSPPSPENTAKFAVLQHYNRVVSVVPVEADHMWNAAMESKSCRLTALGEHYRRLVDEKLL